MSIPWYIPFVKILFMNFCITYIAIKIINYTNINIFEKNLLFINNVVMALLYTILRSHLEIVVLYPIYYFLFTFLFSLIIRKELLYIITVVLISISFALVSMFIASIFNFIFMKIFSYNLSEQNIIEYLVLGIFELILIYFFFKIKRFKNGFSFLKNENYGRYTKIYVYVVSTLIILICISLSISKKYLVKTYLVITLVIGGISMFYWIKRSITKNYKERMKDRTVEIQAEQLKQKDEVIKNLQEELKSVLKINHKYNHRLSAMELAISKFGDKISSNEEFANEYADILDTINKLSKEYKEELDLVTNSNNLPKTNNFSIDNLLEYMKGQANKDNIEFKLKIEENIDNILKIIPEGKIETLLADHIKDAIIAINFSNSNIKKIMVIIRKIDEFYEISIYDTGIEFEIDTLLKLGLENVTTHKETGGTGIGFATTFETLKECNGSLIIEEYNRESEYTKSIKIRFDGKDEYKIKSYRAEDINKQNGINRIIIENI